MPRLLKPRHERAAQKGPERAERKPFLDEVKVERKKIREFYSKRKKIMKRICLEIKKVGKAREKKAAHVNHR
jgi:hypothetical protein